MHNGIVANIFNLVFTIILAAILTVVILFMIIKCDSKISFDFELKIFPPVIKINIKK